MRVSGDGIDSFLGFEYYDVITLASRVFRILIPIIPSSLRFLRSGLGLRCHCFGALLRWGFRFLSWIRVGSCDYSRVTRVLSTSSVSSYEPAFFGFVGVTWCDTPTFLAYPHVFLKCGPFIGFLGFFGVRQILLLALRSAALLADFFRISRFSR